MEEGGVCLFIEDDFEANFFGVAVLLGLDKPVVDYLHTAVAVATAVLIVFTASAFLAFSKEHCVAALVGAEALLFFFVNHYVFVQVAVTLFCEVVELEVVYARIAYCRVLVALLAVALA